MHCGEGRSPGTVVHLQASVVDLEERRRTVSKKWSSILDQSLQVVKYYLGQTSIYRSVCEPEQTSVFKWLGCMEMTYAAAGRVAAAGG